MNLPVNEVFDTLQGEGAWTGAPATFIRLQGCDVGCPWCLSPDARFLTGDFQTVAAGDVLPGMSMIGTSRNTIEAVGRYSRGVVVDVVRRMSDRVRVIFEDRSDAVVSVGHRFVLGSGGRFRRAERLRSGDMLRAYDSGEGQDFTRDFKAGYLAGAADGDGSFHDKMPTTRGMVPLHFVIACNDDPLLSRFHAFAADFGFELNWGLHSSGGQFAARKRIGALRITRTCTAKDFRDFVWRDGDSRDWQVGYLSGMYDTDGSTDGSIMRWHQTKLRTRERLLKVMRSYGLDPVEEGDKNIRIRGGVKVYRPLLAAMRPAISRKVDPLWFQEHRHSGHARVVRVEPIGRGEIISIMTSLGTYVADGLPARNCDTKHTWERLEGDVVSTPAMLGKTSDGPSYAVLAAFDLVGLLVPRSPRHIVITGGEPAAYDLHALTGAFCDAGKTVQIETSGTYPLQVDVRTWVTVSPKVNMPGGREVLDEVIGRAHEIKMPVGKIDDVRAVEGLIARLMSLGGGPPQVWLQPLSASKKATDLCIQAATERGWRVSLQVHKYAGLR